MVTLSGSSSMVFRTHSRQLAVVSPTMPAMRSILICGKPMERAKRYAGPISFDVCARPLTFSKGSGCAFEGDFVGFIPRQQALHTLDQAGELPGGNVRRCPASKVDEFRLAAADEGFFGVEGQFLDRGIQITFHFGGIFVGIDFEVTKVTTLPAKGDVEVDAQRRVGRGQAV